METAIDIGKREALADFEVGRRHRFAHFMDAAERYLANSRSWAYAVFLLGLLQSCLVLIHRPWLDEWQALLIALQSPDWSHLLQNLRYEGHPPLWYAVLLAFGAIIPTINILNFVQLIIAIGTQISILSWRVFNRLERLLITTSYFILIEFGTVSRSLSLGAFITIFFFRTNKIWQRWTIIIMLPLVDFQFGLISFVTIALAIREGQWSRIGIVGWLFSAVFAAWSVQSAPDMIPALDTKAPHLELLRGLIALSSMLVPLHYMQEQWHWAGALPPAIGIALGHTFLLFMIRQLQHDRLTVVLLFGFIALNFLFTAAVYPLAVRHWTLVALLFILLIGWTRGNGPTYVVRASFQIWLVMAALAGLWGAVLSATRPFDTGHQAAEFIRAGGLENKHWVSWPEINGPVPAALLRREIHSLGKDCRQSFIRWNFRSPIKTRKQFERALRKASDKYGRFYLITDQDVGRVVTKGFVRKLAAFNPGYNGQEYQLFVVNPTAPEHSLRPPSCVPGLRPLSEVLS